MVKNRRLQRRGKLVFESLERRQLLAAYINELMFAPFLEDFATGQYVELRGEPNATMDQGSYLVAVADGAGLYSDPGVIHGVFNLSGQTFGSNGFMVILPQGSPYPLAPDLVAGQPGPTVLRSVGPGFSGLPGNIYTSLSNSSNSIDGFGGSDTFFLIHSVNRPFLGDDIDADDNGIIDVNNAAATWEVLDSISMHDSIFSGSVAYGQIAFIQQFIDTNPPVTTPPDTVVVYGEGFGYAARIGDSIGHTLSDWTFGSARTDTSQGTTTPIHFDNDIFGIPLPRPFIGRPLDSLGESNFFGGVHGVVTQKLTDATGVSTLQPVIGVQFLADTNGNGVRDPITYSYDPDTELVGNDITNAFPGVTLTTVNNTGSVIGYTVESQVATRSSNNGNHIFSEIGIPYFNDTSRLRMDFYHPVQSVSIDAMGVFNFTATYGRLEIFDAAGTSLGFVRSRALFQGEGQTLTMSTATDSIAYALAYSDDRFQNSSVSGEFDNLAFTQSEVVGSTDTNGYYHLDYLLPGPYDIVPASTSGTVFSVAIPTPSIDVLRYENFDLSYTLDLNTPPTIDPASFTIAEQLPVGSVIGVIKATDVDAGQTFVFSIENAATSPFNIEPQSGVLSVRNSLALDFEKTAEVIVAVSATDSAGSKSTENIKIKLTNVDEPPVVELAILTVSEDADLNSIVGQLIAHDPEAPLSPVQFAIVGGTGATAFLLEKSTGILRVANVDAIDFEKASELSLQVLVSDNSPLKRSVVVDLMVSITDANDRPVITSRSFTVSENAIAGSVVETVALTDADVNQSHSFTLVSDGGGLFKIDPSTGVISVLTPPNFEQAAAVNVVVQVVDSGTPPRASTQTVKINVQNVDEPASLVNASFAVAENALPGVVVGRFDALDPDGTVGQTFASIDTSNPNLFFGGRIKYNPTTGVLTVAPGATFDAEGNTATLTDRVLIRKGGADVGESVATLTVSNVNEAPVLASQRFGLPKGLPSGRIFVEVPVSDPENDAVGLEVIGAAKDKFAIDANHQLYVLSGVDIDFTATPEIAVQIRATDAAGLATVATVTIFEGPLPEFGTPVAPQTFLAGKAVDFAFPLEYRSETVLSIVLKGPTGKLPDGLRFDPVVARLAGIPGPSAIGVYTLTAEVLQRDDSGDVLKERSVEITITRPEHPLLNTVDALDVDGNGRVEVIDALHVLNFLHLKLGDDILGVVDRTKYFCDTNGDDKVIALDALLVLNQVGRNTRNRAGLIQGESVALSGGEQISKTKTHDAAITGLMDEHSLF